MARTAPGDFERAVSRFLRRELGDRRVSGRAFAEVLGKSEKYTRDRLNDVYAFGLDDVEKASAWLKISAAQLIERSLIG